MSAVISRVYWLWLWLWLCTAECGGGAVVPLLRHSMCADMPAVCLHRQLHMLGLSALSGRHWH